MEKSEENNSQYDDFVRKYIWLVRPCEDYESEVSECTSIRGRFHQYFIHGEALDCTKWLQDKQNCEKCIAEFNSEACRLIIKNETERRMIRLSAAKQNDVWKKRSEPPENWNPPLSEYWVQRSKTSLLHHQNEEYKKYVSTHEPDTIKMCTIL